MTEGIMDYSPVITVQANVDDLHNALAAHENRNRHAVHHSSKTDQHNSPQWLIDKIVGFFGGIDLDPCADLADPHHVPAHTVYTLEDDGLTLDWRGVVYMNPPYGRGVDRWVEKLVREYAFGRTSQAIALTAARPDTQWWARLNDHPVCFVRGRLKFGESTNSAPFPSALFYLGPDWLDFADAFCNIGQVYFPVDQTVLPSYKAP